MTNNDIARQLHIEKINEIKELLKDCKPNTPHYRDLKKYYQKLRKELYVYDAIRRKGSKSKMYLEVGKKYNIKFNYYAKNGAFTKKQTFITDGIIDFRDEFHIHLKSGISNDFLINIDDIISAKEI